ncbi:MAG: hypothetical protein SFT91_05845 [Rickettsiaceae bacterium]|nr:hypothetical protein [Rickettsiaceae bacterium]
MLKGAQIFLLKHFDVLLKDEFDVDGLFSFIVPEGSVDSHLQSATLLQNYSQTAFLASLSTMRGGLK